MAKLHTTRYGKKVTHKTEQLGTLVQVGGNGTGGIEKLAMIDRISLHFDDVIEGVKVSNEIWLDRDEAVKLAKRILAGGTINDIIELAKVS